MRKTKDYQSLVDEGRYEGQEAGVRATILRLGTKRFGAPLPETVDDLENIHDFERLEQLAERLLEAESWDDLMNPIGALPVD